ncbi:MAG: hypothetical protein HRU71_05480 [Planctomycetia bacterium]|nr:MAG: hypothetical protein HRU71_05480 [Planctomycetia bacterium]
MTNAKYAIGWWAALGVFVAGTRVVAFAGDSPATVPLMKAYVARTLPKTGHIRYRMITQYPQQAAQLHRIEARFSGDDLYLKDFGDDDGIRLREPDGQPLLGVMESCAPETIILERSAGRIWRYGENESACGLLRSEDFVFHVDPRIVGLHWNLSALKTPSEMMRELESSVGGQGQRFEIRPKGELLEIHSTVQTDDAAVQTELVRGIAPSKGSSIVYIEFRERNSQSGATTILARTEAEYDLIDGYWWPVRVESQCPRTKFYFLYQLEEASFDKQEHPRRLDGDLLGLPPGTFLGGPAIEGWPQKTARYLGGGKIATDAEWPTIKDGFDLAAYEAWRQRMESKRNTAFPEWWSSDDGRFGIEAVEFRVDEWEAYVRRWVLKHSEGVGYKLVEPLTDKQKSAAQAVLIDCRKRAMPLVEKRLVELREARHMLDSARASAAQSRDASPPGSARQTTAREGTAASGSGKIDQLAAAVKRLESPDQRVAEIFAELKRRLEELLTTRQRDPSKNIMKRPSKLIPQGGKLTPQQKLELERATRAAGG